MLARSYYRDMGFNLDVLILAIHLLAAAAWFGAGWYDRLVISPAIKSSGPAGIEIIKQHILRGGGAKWFAPASMLTVLSGGILYWRIGISMATTSGIMVTIGAALGVTALLMGIIFHAPAEKALKAAVLAGDHDEIWSRANHLERHTTAAGMIVTAAFLLMALRYLIV